MKDNNAIKLALLAGEIMLASGAETTRVEDTMQRLMDAAGLIDPETFCTITGIFASAKDKDGNIITKVRRVQQKDRENNFAKIAKVNNLSRNFVHGKMTIDEALQTLKDIDAVPPYSNLVKVFGAAIASMCFAYMFGGTWLHAINGFLSAALMQIPILIMEKHQVIPMLRIVAGGALGALFALAFINLGLGENIEFVVIGAIMPLVPGVALTNAIRDVLDGNMIAGSARILEALLIAVAIAAGVGTTMATWMSIFGGVFI
ncbi:MAG: threonine/serine exporter family protein [Defluviitaleaceae bacterium]|nr:threonine/serine exporter family protein [Defluviitaleaceae bacterium]